MLYPRNLFEKVWRYRDIPEAVVVTGARQVGKTCLMRLVMQRLRKGSFVYLDLENYRAREIVNRGVEEIVSFVETEIKEKKKYLFIDEVHYADDPSNIIKLLVDHYSFKIKLFVTGSSSLKIKKKFKESSFARGVDRKRIMLCEDLGIERDTFFQLALEALQSIHEELGL